MNAFTIFAKGCTTFTKCLDQGETWAAITKIAIPAIIVLVVMYIAYVAACWFVFKKARYESWKALIPVYNWFIMFQIIGYNKWLSLCMLIPVVNIGFFIWMCLGLAKAFSQSQGFAAGLILLNPVFMWFLAMGKQYEYAYAKGKQVPFADAFRGPTTPTEPVAPLEPTEPVEPEPTELPPVEPLAPEESVPEQPVDPSQTA
ncbi:hypothetical protein IJG66_01365 [Candidatus Saccharibacteria bacterium]|nr:hypothetical protein [Candidatus Saccharibacteria bacterium]